MTAEVPSLGERFRLEARGTCTHCGETVAGWIAFDGQAQVVDSGGFMVFEAGITCDKCLEEN
jgi:hypothetical protein